MTNLLIYEKMYKIRLFENAVLDLYSQNRLSGTTHTSIGQEAVAVASMTAVEDGDFVFSNHRCHGHFLAYCGRWDLLLSEIMGKSTGMCRGRGGSQHICYQNFYSNGIQGGIAPNATGAAFAEKYRATGNIGFVFLGDGTLGQGVVYESLNFASLWQIPIVYIVENNQYAMSTKTQDAVAGSIEDRFRAFGVECGRSNSTDVSELSQIFQQAADYVRNNSKPFCQIIDTYRLSPHSKGDDFRDEDELNYWRKQDPLLKQRDKCTPEQVELLERQLQQQLQVIITQAEESPVDKLFVPQVVTPEKNAYSTSVLSSGNEQCVVAIQHALHALFEQYPHMILFGEDVKDPYGGAFKVTKGLSTAYPERVLNTPISEAGIVGLGVGMAMNGILPIVEIMFGDFVGLCFDQILNHATKYEWMYAGQKNVPLLIRAPMGGGRGYGATHSQSLEKFFVGIPNLHVIALSLLHDPENLFRRIYDHLSSPVLFVEDKRSYGQRQYLIEKKRLEDFYIEEEDALFPVIKLSLSPGESPDSVMITYGANVPTAICAAKELMLEEELQMDIMVLTALSPLKLDFVVQALQKTTLITTLEEGTISNGWGAEVIALLTEKIPGCRYHRFATPDTVLPCGSELEKQILPNSHQIVKKIRSML